MDEYYDGDKLRKWRKRNGLTQERVANKAEIGHRTYQRLEDQGVRQISRSLWRVIEAFKISEETLYPDSGFRSIDSEEFLTFFLGTIDGVRIDIDPFESPEPRSGRDNKPTLRRWRVVKQLADRLSTIMHNRANYSRDEWFETVSGFWRECNKYRISLSYLAFRYEHTSSEQDNLLFATGTNDEDAPVIRTLGQVFLHSAPLYKRLSKNTPPWTADEWKRILFPGMFQTLKVMDPERARPFVVWEEPGISGIVDRNSEQ